MAKRNTKDTILDEALKLFSDRGYEGVTVRDIAAAVGIMQSSLYKHYQSKQDIFDTLVERMRKRFQDAAVSLRLPDGPVEEAARTYASGGTEALKSMSASLFHYYLTDPYASRFRKLLSIEKYRNRDMGRLYREIYIEPAVSYQAALFAEMIRQGFLRQAEPQILALQFFSPIFLLLHEYEDVPELEYEALALLERHIEQFDRLCRREDS